MKNEIAEQLSKERTEYLAKEAHEGSIGYQLAKEAEEERLQGLLTIWRRMERAARKAVQGTGELSELAACPADLWTVADHAGGEPGEWEDLTAQLEAAYEAVDHAETAIKARCLALKKALAAGKKDAA